MKKKIYLKFEIFVKIIPPRAIKSTQDCSYQGEALNVPTAY